MRYNQNWTGIAINEDGKRFEFLATVPGNIQYDFAKAKDLGDMNYGINCLKYRSMESYTWQYVSDLMFEYSNNERVFFVSEGIDYLSSVSINGVEVLKNEGMFSKIEVDITDYLKEKNTLVVTVFPHPKRQGALKDSLREADSTVKPPVHYGWDWHPRLLVSGLWQNTYIETRDHGFINDYSYKYTISEDYSTASLSFQIDCEAETVVELFDGNGNLIYSGDGKSITVNDLKLWWCNGHGEPYLYNYTVSSGSDSRAGKIGFKSIELTMGEGTWGLPPHEYPMTRNNPPICISLNGKQIFGKGSNFVSPEVFVGQITRERYAELIKMAKDANMNMLRLWGGCGIQKESFYDICDEYGIMVWQEFPLACNNYGVYDRERYLKVLEKEAVSIIKLIGRHASLCLWCGGNELFNGWSKMTDQSAALRLLDSLCYRLTPEIPFIMTAPLSGMKHGPYHFCSDAYDDVFQLFQNTVATAYTEFGIKSLAAPEYLKTFMSEEEINNRCLYKNSPWIVHNASFSESESGQEVCGLELSRFNLKKETVDDVYESSLWLQCEGLKAVFEEARRQWPICSMAANWMFNEPWKVAHGWSVVLYPNIKKASYYSVKDALRPVLLSARVPKFSLKAGEMFSAEIWLLDDCEKSVSDTVNIYLTVDSQTYLLSTWEFSNETSNKLGPTVNFKLPKSNTDSIVLKLIPQKHKELISEYKLKYFAEEKPQEYPKYIDTDNQTDIFQ